MRFERIYDTEEFLMLQERWNRLLHSSSQNSIFLTHQWFVSWWKCFSEEKSLELIIIKDDQDAWEGIAPLMRERNSLRFIASQEVSDYCDFIVASDREEEFYAEFLETIIGQYPDIEALELMNLKSDSLTLTLLPRISAQKGFSCTSFESEVAPILRLPPTYEEFLSAMTRRHRHELKRKLRRVNQLGGAKVINIADQQGLQTWIHSFIELHRKSDPSKKAFWNKGGMVEFFKEIVHQFSLEKWVELSLLLDEDKIMALLLNFLYEEEIDFYNVAYDRDYAWYTPGLYLFHHRLSQAIKEGKRKADFLRGREKYKYYFGAKDSKILSLILKPGL